MPRGIYQRTPEMKEHIRLSKLGSTPWNKGKRGGTSWNKGKEWSAESREKMRQAKLDNPTNYWLGKERGEMPWFQKEEVIAKRSGENHYKWNEDRNYILERHRIRGCAEWKAWRTAVFTRDNFTCRDCGVSGVNLEPHHIIPLKSGWDKLFDITNGITLCRPCHMKTFGKEEDFAERYTAILTSV